MHEAEIVIGLLAVVAVLAAAARRAGVPYAPVLVLGGIVLGLIPGVPSVRLAPQVALLGFIPPLVYAAAFRAASFDLRSEASQILTLSTGLVLLTVAVVAVVGRAVAGLGWVAAFVLGALAAPTDPVSASSVIRSVGAPERILAILEGESLINDGTGLAAFQVAVAAAAGGIALGSGALRFVGISLGGCAIGAAAGWLLVWLRRRVDEPSLEIVLGLLAAFGAYVAALVIGASGVLAAVTAGLYSGWRADDISSAETRLQIEPFWDALSFLLETLLFLLIGLQLPTIVRGLSGEGAGTAVAQGAVLVAATLGVRCLWMGALAALPRRRRPLPRRELIVLAAGGMRGALSLAGALSIPLMAGHHAFPERDRVIFMVYAVVVGTLIVPSLGLERLIRRLGLGQEAELQWAEIQARMHVVHAGLARLEELGAQPGVPAPTIERLRGILELRLTRLQARERDHGGGTDGDEKVDDASIARLRHDVIGAERDALAQLRSERSAPAQVLSRIQRDIDLDEARLHS
jgi:CPA1 family monovalent cation:H+ antiporter